MNSGVNNLTSNPRQAVTEWGVQICPAEALRETRENLFPRTSYISVSWSHTDLYACGAEAITFHLSCPDTCIASHPLVHELYFAHQSEDGRG
jgi:hypothetical protein